MKHQNIGALRVCVCNPKTVGVRFLLVSGCLSVSKITPLKHNLKTEVSECFKLKGMKFSVV